jgi:hydroxymethylglutaryl-CoA synthase
MCQAWGRGANDGERSVANYDEDCVTMGVQAALNCLDGVDTSQIDALYFASTTAPYAEKQSASVIAKAIDLPDSTFTADFGDSTRGAANALWAAVAAVKSGISRQVLVVAADMRLGDEDMEQNLGDGAATVLVGSSDLIATIEDASFSNSEIVDYWRNDKQRLVNSWEEGFIIAKGFSVLSVGTAKALMSKNDLSPERIAVAAIYAPNLRRQQDAATALGLNPKTQLANLYFKETGITGTPHCLISLYDALANVKPGDSILMTAYGDGAAAFWLKATAAIEDWEGKGKSFLNPKAYVPSYHKYAQWRGLIANAAVYGELPGSAPVMKREGKALISLFGSRCQVCGTVHYPPQEICSNCHTANRFDLLKLPRQGKIFTYAEDYLFPKPNKPTIMAVVEFANGGRIFTQLTESEPQETYAPPSKLDMEVELVFRKIIDGSGFHHYWWKARPKRS